MSDERKPIALLGGWYEYQKPPKPSMRLELYGASQQAVSEGVWMRAAAMLVGACTNLGPSLGKQHRYTGAVLPMSYGTAILDELLARRVDISELGPAFATLQEYLLEDLPPLAPEIEAAGKDSAPAPPT